MRGFTVMGHLERQRFKRFSTFWAFLALALEEVDGMMNDCEENEMIDDGAFLLLSVFDFVIREPSR